MGKLKDLWQKVKSIKNYEIILSLIIIAIVLLIYFSVSENGKIEQKNVEKTSISLNDVL